MIGRAVILALTLAALTASDSIAQRSEGLSAGQREAIFRRMDVNKDGRLDPDEIPARARSIVLRGAKEAGLDTSGPLDIGKLVAARRDTDDDADDKGADENNNDDRDQRRRGRGDSDRDEDRDRRDRDDDRDEDRDSDRRRSSEVVDQPQVLGFGIEQDEDQKVPGFDVPLDRNSGSNEDGGSESKVEISDKIRRYAQSLVRQYDKNKNGVLEKHEWERMRGDPEKADLNKDSVVTVNELGQRLASYSRRRSRWRDDDDDDDKRSSRRSSSRSSSDDDKKPVYRFTSPHDRLPKELPSWFKERDQNLDGQVSMSEYTRSWNDSAARDFVARDLNGDGILTPDECLDKDD